MKSFIASVFPTFLIKKLKYEHLNKVNISFFRLLKSMFQALKWYFAPENSDTWIFDPVKASA